jgi:hypothetical protein
MHRTDNNQAEIVRTLKAVGATVLDLSMVGGGCPDLLVGFCGEDHKIEIKNPDARGKLRTSQIIFQEFWKGKPVKVVETPEQALNAIGVKC